VLLVAFQPATASGEMTWQEIWTESFDHSMNDGWELHACSAGDCVGVVREGYQAHDRGAGRCIENNVLYGSSRDEGSGHGFSARTPDLETLGVDRTASAYRLDFRYMLLGDHFCWTVPLASPDLILVVSECTAGGTKAMLGVVNERFQDFRPITEITVAEWHDIRIDVDRLDMHRTRRVTIYIDGERVDSGVHTAPYPQRGVMFMDLPALPVAADDPNPGTIPQISCFGSGYWDDIRLSALQEDRNETRQTRLQPVVDPNPFNPATTIQLRLDQASPLDVAVFDLRGRRVRVLHSGIHEAGPVALRWDGRDQGGRGVASGTYLVRIVTRGEATVLRAVLVR
jgi:hypothetical protein